MVIGFESSLICFGYATRIPRTKAITNGTNDWWRRVRRESAVLERSGDQEQSKKRRLLFHSWSKHLLGQDSRKLKKRNRNQYINALSLYLVVYEMILCACMCASIYVCMCVCVYKKHVSFYWINVWPGAMVLPAPETLQFARKSTNEMLYLWSYRCISIKLANISSKKLLRTLKKNTTSSKSEQPNTKTILETAS